MDAARSMSFLRILKPLKRGQGGEGRVLVLIGQCDRFLAPIRSAHARPGGAVDHDGLSGAEAPVGQFHAMAAARPGARHFQSCGVRLTLSTGSTCCYV